MNSGVAFSRLPRQRMLAARLINTFAEYGPMLCHSGAAGTADYWSDVDLELTEIKGQAAADVALQKIGAILDAERDVLSWFPASHIGLNYLVVSIWRVGNGVAKADISIGVMELPDQALSEFSLSRSVGWIYYAHGRIERGEVLEAASAIDLIRDSLVLPVILREEECPAEGYRRAENRLDKQSQKLLWNLRKTSPDKLILRAMLDLAISFLCSPARQKPFGPVEPLIAIVNAIRFERDNEDTVSIQESTV